MTARMQIPVMRYLTPDLPTRLHALLDTISQRPVRPHALRRMLVTSSPHQELIHRHHARLGHTLQTPHSRLAHKRLRGTMSGPPVRPIRTPARLEPTILRVAPFLHQTAYLPMQAAMSRWPVQLISFHAPKEPTSRALASLPAFWPIQDTMFQGRTIIHRLNANWVYSSSTLGRLRVL